MVIIEKLILSAKNIEQGATGNFPLAEETD
jgi:hypothetical protein